MIRMFDRSRRARLLLVLLLVASLVIISVGFRSDGDGPLDSLGRVALSVLSPLQKGLVTVFRPVGNFFTGFTRVPSLKAEITRLKQENAQLRAQQEQVTDLQRENAALRELLVLKERFNLRTITTQVIGVGPTNFGRTVFIDKGTAEGVRKNMPVLGENGLVGRVVRAARSEATVLLLLDRGSAVAASIASNGEQGVVEGEGSGSLRLRLLDPDAKVVPGDKVVTSGYDRGLFPPGIPIGTVTEAPPARSHLTRDVKVEPKVDFSRLEYVLVVTGEKASGR